MRSLSFVDRPSSRASAVTTRTSPALYMPIYDSVRRRCRLKTDAAPCVAPQLYWCGGVGYQAAPHVRTWGRLAAMAYGAWMVEGGRGEAGVTCVCAPRRVWPKRIKLGSYLYLDDTPTTNLSTRMGQRWVLDVVVIFLTLALCVSCTGT